MVVGRGPPNNKVVKEAQVLLDVYMLRGIRFEREQHEWKRVFKAELCDYPVMPTLGTNDGMIV